MLTVLCFRKWECLKLFLKKGCDADLCNQMGQSAVHLACLMSDIESVRILLQASADPNSIDRLGISPLAYCISNGMLRKEMSSAELYYIIYNNLFPLMKGFETFAHLLIDGGAKEDLTRLSLVRLKKPFRESVQKRMHNPLSMRELARMSLIKVLNPHLEEWLDRNKSELPRTLVPYLLYKHSG
jgi:ankyrin repeat protein